MPRQVLESPNNQYNDNDKDKHEHQVGFRPTVGPSKDHHLTSVKNKDNKDHEDHEDGGKRLAFLSETGEQCPWKEVTESFNLTSIDHTLGFTMRPVDYNRAM